MATRRSLLKAGLAGAAAAAFAGTGTAQSRRVLRIHNPGDRKQVVTVRIDGRVELGPESESDEDAAYTVRGEGVVRSVLDPDAYDSFYVRGPIRSVDWTGAEPRIWLDGRRVDPSDYRDDDDDDDDDDEEYPSRVQFVATEDDLEAFLRVSGSLETGDSEIRVVLDRDETRGVRYSGNIRELRTANGEIDVYVTQR
jgi:hypothetical protein